MNRTPGILRKSNYHQNIEPSPDLLVFGYQSKLYRDDVKALEFDRETHLIPAPYLNKDKDLISRYDVRATLETAPCESHDNFMNRLNNLSASEQEAERLAEKERYYSLFTNEVEEELYKEEQQKRNQSTSNQVPFNYDDDIGPKVSVEPQEQEENDTTPFIPSVKLDLPVDMEIPPTLKLNQIIEKTAKFISSQGPQMEILLKTKQSSNPQFNFLNHDGQLNSYYKHILGMMKTGTYPWQEILDKSGENSQDSEDFNSLNGTTENSAPAVSIVIPKLKFKPSADCAYTQLISKITKAPIAEIEKQQRQEPKSAENGASLSVACATDIVKKPSGLMGLVHYSSDSDSDHEEENVIPFTGLMPPSDLQLVIDKTAMYVAKNGYDFEATLRKKKDARFEFLDKSSEYNQYYIFKVNESRGTSQPLFEEKEKPKEEVKPPPVCFSIKPKEDKAPLKPTILQASSDDENKDKKKIPSKVSTPPRMTTVEEELELQVDAMNAEREEKQAKEKLNDKLLNAAREKLGMLPKEKMLQIERKKKALMFINQIKGSNGSATNGDIIKEDEIINLTHYGDDSDDSIKSIPLVPSPKAEKSRPSRRSRSRSRKRTSSSSRSKSPSPKRSRSSSHKRSKTKKSKSHRSKKKYRKKSRSRSRSYTPTHKRERHDRRY